MGRPKKNAIALNVKLETEIMKRFEAYCDELGQTKTKALERILQKHLDEYAVAQHKAGSRSSSPEGIRKST